jgi:hypothetical protein
MYENIQKIFFSDWNFVIFRSDPHKRLQENHQDNSTDIGNNLFL